MLAQPIAYISLSSTPLPAIFLRNTFYLHNVTPIHAHIRLVLRARYMAMEWKPA